LLWDALLSSLPPQATEVENASWYANNCWPELPANRVPGIFAFLQMGEVLAVRSPQDGEDWMRLNPRHDEQRWSVLNSQMAVLAASRDQRDRMMLEQFDSLVQPTQYLEYLRKSLPMTDAHLDMVSTMHDTMMRRLNAREVLYKGGQQAVDKFMPRRWRWWRRRRFRWWQRRPDRVQ
jgi:hypothetical protein